MSEEGPEGQEPHEGTEEISEEELLRQLMAAEGNREAAKACERPEMLLLFKRIADVVATALWLSIKVVVDVEPTLYESAVSLLSMLAACSRDKGVKSSVMIKDKASNAYYRLTISMYSWSRPRPDEVVLAIVTKSKSDEIRNDLDSVLTSQRLVYMLVVPQRPDISISTSLYVENLVLEAVKMVLGDLNKGTGNGEYLERLRYAGRLPHELVLLGDVKELGEAARLWSPQPPAHATYLAKRPRALDEIVLPKALADAVKDYLRLIRRIGHGSLTLIGLPGSGRKTLAAAMARELGVPAYYISLSNVLGKFVGESEGKLSAFFTSLRARGPSLAVFDGIEALFKRSGSEEVQANLLNILTSEMARDDNNFVIVFTVRENATSEVLGNPLLGELKLVMPLPTLEERRLLARRFFEEIASLLGPGTLDKLRELARSEAAPGVNIDADASLEDTYVAPFVSVSVGMTPGELYRGMLRVLAPALEDSLSQGRLVPVADEAARLLGRNLSVRLGQVRDLVKRAVELGETDVADVLLEVYNELSKRSLTRQSEMSRYRLQ